MNSTELNTFLQQAICCAGNKTKQVADMFLQGSKCAKAELKKLAILIDAIKALDCYRAPLEEEVCTVVEGDPLADPIGATFTLSIPCNITLSPSSTVSLSVYNTSGDFSILASNVGVWGDDLDGVFINNILPQLAAYTDYTATYTSGDCASNEPLTYTITGPCDFTALELTYILNGSESSTTINGIETQAGICNATSIECETTTTEYTNCLTETEADNLVNMITKICDTCNCN